LRSRTMAESVVDSLSLRARVTSPRGAQRAELFEHLDAGRNARAGEWAIRPGAEGVEVAPLGEPGEVQRFGAGETLRFGGMEAVLTREGLSGSEIRVEVEPYSESVRRFQRTLDVARPNREADVVRISYAHGDSVLVRDVVNT